MFTCFHAQAKPINEGMMKNFFKTSKQPAPDKGKSPAESQASASTQPQRPDETAKTAKSTMPVPADQPKPISHSASNL